MNTKIKLLMFAAGIYFFTGCDNGSTTTTDKDTTTMNSQKSDTSMSTKMDDMKKTDGMMASMNKMMDNMESMKMSGDFDMDFANMMIEHHQGAIDMSAIEVKSGTDAGIKSIAKNISI